MSIVVDLRPSRDRHRRERGVVLIVSLLVLVVLTISTVAILRTVNSGLLIAGNVSLKRSATTAADFALEQGRRWISNPPAGADLTGHGAGGVANGVGYYATYTELAALTTATWNDSNSVAVASPPPGDYQLRYVIHRLCRNVGAIDASSCVMASAANSGSMSSNHYALTSFPTSGAVYYRITARIQGPKNTISYVQASLY